MKAKEIETTRNQEGQMDGPPDSAWRALGRRRFEEAYCDEDALYEQLITEAPGR